MSEAGANESPMPWISESGSRRSRFVAVPVKGRSAEADRLLPRYKGIYHVGCTDYPNPTYP